MRHWLVLVLFLLGLGTLRIAACGEDSCVEDEDCNDGNPCTRDWCPEPLRDISLCGAGEQTCQHSWSADGTPCGSGNVCVDSVCGENPCEGVVCDDGNECTDNLCDLAGGATCSNPNDDTNTCTSCAVPPCICDTGVCISGCWAEVDAPGIPMACRNSFNQAVSTFLIDLLNVNTQGSCVEANQPVDFAIDPAIALDTAFLQAAAQVFCDLGAFLTEVDVTSAQISIDAIAGATCTEQLTTLPGTPVTVPIANTLTCVGGTNDGAACTVDGDCIGGACPQCGSGGVVIFTPGISLPLPLPSVVLPCTAGATGSEVQICSTGEVPLSISLADPPVQTFVGVSVAGGSIDYQFQCNTSSTTVPAPGTSVSCTAPSLSGECASLPPGNVGETPFPVSDCDFSSGFPGTCTTVPVAVDPSTVCATFMVQ